MTQSPICVDLFAGAGGLTTGFHRAGWNSSFCIEKDSMSFDTFYHNLMREGSSYFSEFQWPEGIPITTHNIVDFLKNDNHRKIVRNLELDAVIGGPPCQGFSVGGKRLADDPRNLLPAKFVEFVRLSNPNYVVMENVEGLTHKLRSANGVKSKISPAQKIVQELERDDRYDATYRVIDGLDYGIPQNRKRTIILATSKGLRSDHMSFWEELARLGSVVRRLHGISNQRITVADAIGDLWSGSSIKCPDAPRFNSVEYTPIESKYQEIMRKSLGNATVPDSHRLVKHGEIVRRRHELIQQRAEYGRPPKKWLRSLGKYSTKKHKIHWLNPHEPSSTVASNPSDLLHPHRPREITVREMARLQSFPDDYQFKGRYTINGPRRKHDTARCSQVGNAVPPLLSEGIGLALKGLMA